MTAVEYIFYVREMLTQAGVVVCDLTYPPKDQLDTSETSVDGKKSYNSYITATMLIKGMKLEKSDVSPDPSRPELVSHIDVGRFYLFCRNRITPAGQDPQFSSFEFGNYQTRSFNRIFKVHIDEYADEFAMIDDVSRRILGEFKDAMDGVQITRSTIKP